MWTSHRGTTGGERNLNATCGQAIEVPLVARETYMLHDCGQAIEVPLVARETYMLHVDKPLRYHWWRKKPTCYMWTSHRGTTGGERNLYATCAQAIEVPLVVRETYLLHVGKP